jgi:hypothetical protein
VSRAELILSTASFSRDDTSIAAEAALDGIYVIRTTSLFLSMNSIHTTTWLKAALTDLSPIKRNRIEHLFRHYKISKKTKC